MNILIRKTKSFFRLIKRDINWKREVKLERRKLRENIANPFDFTGRIVILIPHSDDEWIGCSRIINTFNNDVTLCDIDMSGGDSESVHLRRKQEMKN
ncbi:MAG: hypothetical protein E7255_05875, partial [Lachnospiraceae bacterium]|nr:hypothetical protein [Lachnospiraceae bacterium]